MIYWSLFLLRAKWSDSLKDKSSSEVRRWGGPLYCIPAMLSCWLQHLQRLWRDRLHCLLHLWHWFLFLRLFCQYQLCIRHMRWHRISCACQCQLHLSGRITPRSDSFGTNPHGTNCSGQCRIANHQVCLARYDYSNWNAMSKSQDKLPNNVKEEFKVFINEGCLVSQS